MKTASIILTLLWNLPLILKLIGRLRELFPPEKVQEALAAINELIAKICPPAHSTDSAGNNPAKRALFAVDSATAFC